MGRKRGKSKKPGYTRQNRKSRGRAIHSLAKTTKGGKGKIKKRRAYKKYMK